MARVTATSVLCPALQPHDARMSYSPFGRRHFLSGLAAGAGALWLGAPPASIRAALRDASTATGPWRILSPGEASALDALTSRIFPTDDTPGAHEAGVVRFIDQALASFAAADLPLIRSGVVELDREARRRAPASRSYFDAGPVIQTDIVRQLDATHSTFFEVVRVATIQGMFANPEYGGNQDKVGWKLIGFEDRFVWQEPFGDYDR